MKVWVLSWGNRTQMEYGVERVYIDRNQGEEDLLMLRRHSKNDWTLIEATLVDGELKFTDKMKLREENNHG